MSPRPAVRNLPGTAVRTLAEPRRQALFLILREGELCVSDLHARMPEVTVGAVSQHLRVLYEAGLVERRASGKQRLYRPRVEALDEVMEWLTDMWGGSLARLGNLAAAREHRRGRNRNRRRP